MAMFLSKTYVIITGASKGFGRSVACSLAKEFSQHEEGKTSVLVLLSRSMEGLEMTRDAVLQICSDINVHLIAQDLGDIEGFSKLIPSLFCHSESNKCEYAMLINNAGSLGDKIKSITSYTDVGKIQEYMDLNMTSCFYLTSSFLNHFASAKKTVINISSKCAVLATPSLSLYCAGKAARDMFHEVLALESKEVRVLNYAPGPLKTDMYEDIANNSDNDDVRKLFIEMKEKDIVLDPGTSAEKLMVLLKQNRYQSGAHIDYFDELPS